MQIVFLLFYLYIYQLMFSIQKYDLRFWPFLRTHVINANKMIHNELVLLVCFSTVDDMILLIWSNPIHYKKSMQIHIFIIELQYQYLNYIFVSQIFSMKLRKDWGQPKIMTDKSGAFLCVRLTDHTKLQLHLLQQKLNPSRSLS